MTDLHQRNASQYDLVPYKNWFVGLRGRFNGVLCCEEFLICDVILYMHMPNLRQIIRELIWKGYDDGSIIAAIESLIPRK